MSQLKSLECKQCKNTFFCHVSRVAKYCSRPCYIKSIKGIIPKNIQSGVLWTQELNLSRRNKLLREKAPNWGGDKIGYQGIHSWLRREYPKTGKCSSVGCNSGKRTEWALLSGKKYERRKENFIELCVKCHRIYDKTGTKGWITKKLKKLK